jgi:hypothetical protein
LTCGTSWQLQQVRRCSSSSSEVYAAGAAFCRCCAADGAAMTGFLEGAGQQQHCSIGGSQCLLRLTSRTIIGPSAQAAAGFSSFCPN